MIEFFVYSRPAIEAVSPHDVPHIIVSIWTPGDPKGPAKIKFGPQTKAMLQLSFADAEGPVAHEGIGDEHLFHLHHAHEIVEFVREHGLGFDLNRFIVHCDAGRSRSAAVAAALSKIYTGTDKQFFKQYNPSRRVHRLILEAHHTTIPEPWPFPA